jgi:hypothetical protein
MPAAGTTKIPRTKKARIIAENRVGLGTTAEIAKKYKVAPKTVKNLVSSPPASILPLVKNYEKRFSEIAASAAEKGLVEIDRRLSSENVKNESLKNVVGATKLVYDVHRLQTNQPTSINQSNQAPVDRALKYAEILIGKYKPEDARKIFRASKTARIGMGASEEEWIEAEVATFDK